MLNTGNALLILAFILSLVMVYASVLSRKDMPADLQDISQHDVRMYYMQKYMHPLLYIIIGLLTAALLLLLYFFTTNDLSYYYIAVHSNADLPLFYKIAGVWAGQEGTFLLWTWIVYISLSIVQGKSSGNARLACHLLGLFFIFITIVNSPFKLFAEYGFAAQAPSSGSSLDPILLNFWMAIHPPLTFAAYGLTTVPAAFALGHLFKPDRKWNNISLPFTRLSWIFFTIGIGFVGGLWNYEAGWGLWVWDPVQTASLIPWLLLTASLHARSIKSFENATPLLTIFTFASVLFATFVTRSGIWGSVHEFTSTSTEILFAGAMVIITILALIGFGRNRTMDKNNEAITPREDTPSTIPINSWKFTISNLKKVAVLLLLVMTAVSFVGLLIPLFTSMTTGSKISVDSTFFNLASLLITICLALALGGYSLISRYEQHSVKRMVAGVLLLTLLFAIVPAYPLSDHGIDVPVSTLLILPSYLFALAGIFLALYASVRDGNPAMHLIHLGLILVLLSASMSAILTTTTSFEYGITEIGSTKSVDSDSPYEFRLAKYLTQKNQHGNWVQTVTMDVIKGNELTDTIDVVHIRDDFGESFSKISIKRGLLSDVYVKFPGLAPKVGQPPTIPIGVKIIPAMSFYWLGFIFMGVGAIWTYYKNTNR